MPLKTRVVTNTARVFHKVWVLKQIVPNGSPLS
jgi:hypothetical protein